MILKIMYNIMFRNNMKHLKDFLECNFATPMNTPGMGGITAPEGTTPGSGDIPQGITKKVYKKKKSKFKK